MTEEVLICIDCYDCELWEQGKEDGTCIHYINNDCPYGYYEEIDDIKTMCPECRHELEFMISYHEEDYLVGLFDCDKCGSAWKIKETEKGFEEPERYFFG